jgi:rhamnosyltransferase
MRSNNKVAIILCSFNGERYIKKQVESILSQNYKNIDLFIFDDCSDDRTIDILKKFHKKIYLKENKKNSGSATKNFFKAILKLNLKKYNYISFSDQDDIWFKFKIKRAIKYLSKNKFEGYSSNVLAFNDNNKKTINDKSMTQKKFDHMFESPGPGCTHVITQKLFNIIKKKIKNKKNIIKKINHHDWFFYSLCRNNNFNWFIDKKCTMLYRQHDFNEIGENVGIKAMFKRFIKVWNGYYLEQIYYISKYTSPLGKKSIISDSKKIYFKERIYLIYQFYNLRRNYFDRVVLLFFLVFFII